MDKNKWETKETKSREKWLRAKLKPAQKGVILRWMSPPDSPSIIIIIISSQTRYFKSECWLWRSVICDPTMTWLWKQRYPVDDGGKDTFMVASSNSVWLYVDWGVWPRRLDSLSADFNWVKFNLSKYVFFLCRKWTLINITHPHFFW